MAKGRFLVKKSKIQSLYTIILYIFHNFAKIDSIMGRYASHEI